MTYEEAKREFDLQKETDRLLASFAPASVVIDAQMEILHFHGNTDPYLGPAPGRASLNLFKMARAGLDLELRTAISKARKSGLPVKKTGIELNDHAMHRDITIEVLPLNASTTERYFVVLFAEAGASVLDPASPGSPNGRPGSMTRQGRGAKDRRIRELEQELASTREEMRRVIEELEAANEELNSANEESLSSNEELQSLNEELETSKEEIQATNEELLVLNTELQQRNGQLQEARDFADAIVETIREPLLVLDANLRIQRANLAFYRHFQMTSAETVGYRIYELENGQWNIPSLRTLLEEMLPTNHSFTDYEVEHAFPSIGQRIMLLNAQHIDGSQRLLLALDDITELKQATNEKQQMLTLREEFMAVASHELKTPVTSLKGYTQMLHARFSKAGDERAALFLQKMDDQLDKLIHLISELLDMTKLEAGQLAWRTQPFDLGMLVQEIAEEAGYTTERHQIRIEGDLSRLASGDREYTGQVLTNLLSNAIKYSPQADTVLVKYTSDTDTAIVSVQDFGIGIASEKLAHIFDRFYRVSDKEHATFPGLGLGLFISAEIVKRQGGRMWVESQPGVSSTFFFTIPLAPPAEPGTFREEGK